MYGIKTKREYKSLSSSKKKKSREKGSLNLTVVACYITAGNPRDFLLILSTGYFNNSRKTYPREKKRKKKNLLKSSFKLKFL